ncbi:MAG: hypothetical protein IT424_16105 [Pirellulales bacterium]|nr:hypothetical protein [Pirellulales bacterium]
MILDAIAPDARIPVVHAYQASCEDSVREAYSRLRPIGRIPANPRGWTLDVLRFARSLSQAEFYLQEMYAFEHALGQLYPANRHVRPKIRQQLQVLRDAGILTFIGQGRYRFND